MYTFEYTLDEEDFASFNKYHLMNSPSFKIKTTRTGLVYVAISIMLFLFALFLFLDGQPAFISFILWWLCGGMFFGGMIVIFDMKYTSDSATSSYIKKTKKEGRLPFNNEPVRVQFGDNNMHLVTELHESEISYRIIERVVEDVNAIYLYYITKGAFILPHRAFESGQQKAEFLTFINGKVSQTA